MRRVSPKTAPALWAMKRRKGAASVIRRAVKPKSLKPLLGLSDIASEVTKEMKEIMHRNSWALREMKSQTDVPVDIGEHPLKAGA